MSLFWKKIWRGICFGGLSLFLAACTAYQPPFTHYLEPTMSFADVLNAAQGNGYKSYCEIADYKSYRLLCFKNDAGGSDVFLVVNKKGKPMLRTLEYGSIDEEKLVNFVDDLLIHGKGSITTADKPQFSRSIPSLGS